MKCKLKLKTYNIFSQYFKQLFNKSFSKEINEQFKLLFIKIKTVFCLLNQINL